MRPNIDPVAPSTKNYLSSDYVARTYDVFFNGNQLFAFDTALLDQSLPAGCRVLDLGCGTGRHIISLSRKGCSVVGVDLSDHMLRVCNRKLRSLSLTPALIKASICDLSFIREGAFDAAICMFSTIGLIRGSRNRERFLRGVRSALKPGGLLILHTHNFYHNLFDPVDHFWPIKSTFSALIGRSELGDKILSYYRSIRDMYVHVFRDNEVRRMLERCGFAVRRTVYLNESRNAELHPSLPNRFRANGFIFVAEAI